MQQKVIKKGWEEFASFFYMLPDQIQIQKDQ